MAYPVEFKTAYETQVLSEAFIADYHEAEPAVATMDFVSDNTVATVAGLQTTVVRDTKNATSVASRAFNSNYPVVNSTPEVEHFMMKTFGGAFEVDLELDAALGGSLQKRELASKSAHAMLEFQRQLLLGGLPVGTGPANPNEMLGFDAYCTQHAALANGGMVIPDKLQAVGAMTEAQAFAILEFFENVISDMKYDANRIYTSKLFAAKLFTAQSIMRRQTDKVTIAGKDYRTFMDIALIGVDNSLGLRKTVGATTEITEDIYVAKVGATNYGIYCATPPGEGKYVTVQKAVQVGQPLAQGYVDWKTNFVPAEKMSLRKCTATVKL